MFIDEWCFQIFAQLSPTSQLIEICMDLELANAELQQTQVSVSLILQFD